MPTKPRDIREQVLKDRGIATVKSNVKHHRRLKPVPMPTIGQELKTPMMRYLELKAGKPIENLLLTGSLSYVAKQLDNEVDVSTVSKWIKRLKLRYTKDNLPDCDTCSRLGPACESGVCYILVELGLYELLILKRTQMFNG